MLGLVVVRSAFGIVSLLGLVFLTGLVNKDAIILVDRIYQRRGDGLERDAAILEAGPMRLRPIMMTTASAVFGMTRIARTVLPAIDTASSPGRRRRRRRIERVGRRTRRPQVSNEPAEWDLPAPHVTTLVVASPDIDAYDHVNNAVYVTWLDRAAWSHSAALGLPVERCLEIDRGMAVLRSVITYVRPAVLGDTVLVGTWLLAADYKLRARRRFQVRRAADGATLVRAEIEYVCIELSSGRPARAPAEFRDRYVALADVARAYAALPPL